MNYNNKNKIIAVFLFIIVLIALPVGAFCADCDGYIVRLRTPDEGIAAPGAVTDLIFGDLYSVKGVTEDELKADPNVLSYEPDFVALLPDTDEVRADMPQSVLPMPGMYSLPADIQGVFANTVLPCPNDPGYVNQWNQRMTGADTLRFFGSYDSSIRIGLIDSGSASQHPDIKNAVVAEKNYAKILVNGEYKDAAVYDNYGHATFITGLLAADTDNGIGIAGIFPQASIVSLKVMDGNSATISLIQKAIYDAVDEYNCDVVNLSLTTPYDISTLRDAVNYALSKGVIIVAASGNKGKKPDNVTPEDGTELLYPAAYPGVIGVGSVNRYYNWFSGSHYNSSVDACAPGSMVYSTYTGGRYIYGTGTSYAAPHLAAAAALAKSFDRTIDSEGFMRVLENTCRQPDGSVGRNDKFGYGLVDFYAIAKYMGEQNSLTLCTYFDLSLSDDAAKGSITVKNYTSSDVSGDLYVAVYSELDDGSEILTGCTVIDGVTVPKNGEYKTDSLSIPAEGSASAVRVFMLDENLAPITQAVGTVISKKE